MLYSLIGTPIVMQLTLDEMHKDEFKLSGRHY
jgi:hypothetical protein